jgi:hypothetical protein
MSDENTPNDDEQPAAQSDERNEAEAGPPEDIENDPAYNPDDPGLKAAKGG